MPVLDNPKHERFAQELAKGKTADEAYQLAGYEENRGNATRLKANESVAARIAELLTRAATRTETTVETLLEAAWGIINEARAAADYGAASQTVERAAKIAGHWIEKRQTDSTIRTLADLDDDTLTTIASAGRNRTSGETQSTH